MLLNRWSSSFAILAMIGQFVSDVAWGELDVLLVDTPPGTSDEHLAILENLKKHKVADGAVLVTTPQVKKKDQLNECLETWSRRLPSSTSCLPGGVNGGCQERGDILQENGIAHPGHRGKHERLCLPSLLGGCHLVNAPPPHARTHTHYSFFFFRNAAIYFLKVAARSWPNLQDPLSSVSLSDCIGEGNGMRRNGSSPVQVVCPWILS